jgi:hypothetical protein
MFMNALIQLRRRLLVGGSVEALATACLGGAGALAADPDKAVDKIRTATPIKHVLIIVGGNRSFDKLFATYVPKNRDERVLNLLSERIIKADGSPGKNFAKAHQFRVTSAPWRQVFCQRRYQEQVAIWCPACARYQRGAGGVTAFFYPEHSGRRPGPPAARSVPLRHRRNGASRHARPRHAHHQRHNASAGTVPVDGADDAI